MKWEYLLFNLVILGSAVFLPRLFGIKIRGGYKTWLCIAIVAIIFLIWDQMVTGWWWTFNPNYVLGLYIGRLPVEEVLFFFTVPRACMVIWELLSEINERELSGKNQLILFLLFCGGMSGMVERYYLMSVCWLLAGLFLFDIWNKRTLIYSSIVLILTALFNGYLTSRPVVLYASGEIVGFRIGTIPIEDFLYGLSLVLMVLIVYKFVTSTQKKEPKSVYI